MSVVSWFVFVCVSVCFCNGVLVKSTLSTEFPASHGMTHFSFLVSCGCFAESVSLRRRVQKMEVVDCIRQHKNKCSHR